MVRDFELDFDIVVINKFREALPLMRFFKKTFNIKYRFYKGYYAISFDKHTIEKTTHFWDKNTYWKNKHINIYQVAEYIENGTYKIIVTYSHHLKKWGLRAR